jgi:hypothetical protein
MPGLEFSDERSLGDLIAPVGREYIHPLRTKWQLPGDWRAGDEVPRPLDVSSFANQLGMQPELAKALDDKMTRTFKDAIAEQPAELSARRDGGHALLAVQDQGPGIPLADRDRIFQRHVRLNSPTTRHSGGLGLGLYIAQQLATADRGQLQLSHSPGSRGARFELRLPLATPTPGRRVPNR